MLQKIGFLPGFNKQVTPNQEPEGQCGREETKCSF